MSAAAQSLLPGIRPRSRRVIYPPSSLRPVADVDDPEHGAEELHPCPGLDAPGSVYLVGVEGEWWHVGAYGEVVSPRGELPMRQAVRELQRRGARLMYCARAWLPDLIRDAVDAPLRMVF